ncbi:MAG: TetR/AcrR family transcriptional regulator [Proteobacteria bacterium]|nr:TetR/AcrR family transcriptional regulator [Pseudomonadota bacterium]
MAAGRRIREPRQARALATRERLIAAAAELLGEVGVERLSTNLICARAGVTPPAFYRYFRDKYAALEELGERLMEAQNQVIAPLLERRHLVVSEADLRGLILGTIRVTQQFPGGAWVLRALRAVPALQHVRLRSHRRMSALIAKAARKDRKTSARQALEARLLIDMGYAAIELAFDEPGLKPAGIAEEAAPSLTVLAKAILRARQVDNRQQRREKA